jgi:iron complex transport system substrate-binding protein
MMSRFSGVLLAASAAALCLTAAAPAAAVSYRDMAGREVTLAALPARIVSLVPSVTELVYALGGQDRLVGRTDFCDYPPAALGKPSVGGMVSPSLEAIVTLRPDLVVVTAEGNREETFAQLRRLGFPTYAVAVHRMAEVMDLVARVGALVGRPQAVLPLVTQMDERIARVRALVKPYRAPRVLYVVWPEPLIVPGRHALVNELIEIAGGRSVTASDGDAYPRLSLEAAVAAAPEVVLLASYGAGAAAGGQEKWERLAGLRALKSARLYTVDGDLMHRYGPRLLDGLTQIARALHPEAFK